MTKILGVHALAAVLLASAPRLLGAQALVTPPGSTSEAVTIQRPGGQLAGTLLVPHASGPVPVVLLIAGSGPTDRDGNARMLGVVPGTLQELADSLARHGIATLRYDKRGVGASAFPGLREANLSFYQYATDASEWIPFLRADHRFSRVIVAGHSEGALLGLIAMRGTVADAYISLEGPARPADEVIHDQIAHGLPRALPSADSILARLKQGHTTDSVPPALAALFRPSVQPYLITWFNFSGSGELRQVRVPCLIVQGTHDLEVDSTEASMLHRANPRCRVALIPGMDHMLKASPANMSAQLASYRTPDVPLAPGVADAILSFITSLGK